MSEKQAKRNRRQVNKARDRILVQAMKKMKDEPWPVRLRFGWRVFDQSPRIKLGISPLHVSMHYRDVWGVQLSVCFSLYSAGRKYNGNHSGWSVELLFLRLDWMG